MGEDSCRNNIVDKKNVADIHVTNGIHHHHHFQNHNMNSSTISSCSEADSESTTCVGDAEENNMTEDQDYQYGPGIVSKLRTKFLSITLKQSRGGVTSMRRSCSLENILDQKTAISPTSVFISPSSFGITNESKSSLITSPWSNLKRAKSMDTLLLSVTEEQKQPKILHDLCSVSEANTVKLPKVIRRKDGPLNRTTITICDEELPKPDTVKTYKRMFEPAESKKTSANSNVRRRPPVLRATAKSGSTSSGKSVAPSGKMNGFHANPSPSIKTGSAISKCKSSAKDSNMKESCPKMISTAPKNEMQSVEENRNLIKNSVNANLKKKELPTMNGLMKAEPIKFKQKEDPLKRHIRVPKHLEGDGISKPAHKKSSSHSKNNIHPIAQALEKLSTVDKNFSVPKHIAAPKSEKFEKPVFKPILAKCDEQTLNNSTATNCEELDSAPNGVGSELNTKIILPPVENGIHPVQKENSVVSLQSDSIFKLECHDSAPNKPLLNGFSKADNSDSSSDPHTPLPCVNKKETPGHLTTVAEDGDKLKEVSLKTNTVKLSSAASTSNSMIFDFRGKDVVSHLAIIPAPFGCRKVIPAVTKKRSVLLDGKELYALNGFANGDAIGTDEDDDDFVDYSLPQPCGLVFEGENVRVGKGAILATRNKDLKIQFDEDVEKNTFVYPSESSYLSDDSSSLSSSDFSSLEDNPAKLTNGVIPTAKLRANTAIGTTGVGGLMSYTPSVLRTVDNFQPGIFRPPDKDDKKSKDGSEKSINEGEEENRETKDDEQNGDMDGSDVDSAMLKPADPEFISSWSLSTNTSDLLF